MYFRKRNGKWLVEIKKKGYPRRAKTFLSKEIARIWAKEIELQMEKESYEDYSIANKTTLKEILIKYLKEKTLLKKGHREEGCKVKILINNDISNLTLTKLRSQHLYSLKRELSETRKPSTVKAYLQIIRNAWNVSKAEWGILLPPQSPFDLFSFDKFNDTRDRVLSREEYEKLLEACKSSNLSCLYDIVQFAYLTGARQGEILKLKREHINFDKKTCIFYDTKNSEDREIGLSDYTITILKRYPFGWNIIPRRLRKHFSIACKKAMIENFRFHDLRACFCTNSLTSGMSIAEVSSISGHKTWSQLKRYTRIKPENLIYKLNQIQKNQ